MIARTTVSRESAGGHRALRGFQHRLRRRDRTPELARIGHDIFRRELLREPDSWAANARHDTSRAGTRHHALVERLALSSIGGTFNRYAEEPRATLLRSRLAAYLEAKADSTVLLVGEAAGYRGARVSGIPFTSERQRTGRGPAEATATIVHRVLSELELEECVLLWNVVPTHPGNVSANRPPTSAEIAAGLPFVRRLEAGRRVVAVGRLAHAALGGPHVRHPSHGGAKEFRAGLVELLDRGELDSPGPA